MAKSHQSGFTLIELILVMAISSSLATIAFIGQAELRSRAQFDGSVDKLVSTINDARNEATSGVNIVGSGNGAVGGCTPGVSGSTIFRGTSWSFLNTPTNPISVDYYESTPAVGSCKFDSRTFQTSPGITASVAGGGPKSGVLFIRNDTGGLDVCPVLNFPSNILTSYQNGQCAVGTPTTITFKLVDLAGHSSDVYVDGSGLAKRLN